MEGSVRCGTCGTYLELGLSDMVIYKFQKHLHDCYEATYGVPSNITPYYLTKRNPMKRKEPSPDDVVAVAPPADPPSPPSPVKDFRDSLFYKLFKVREEARTPL